MNFVDHGGVDIIGFPRTVMHSRPLCHSHSAPYPHSHPRSHVRPHQGTSLALSRLPITRVSIDNWCSTSKPASPAACFKVTRTLTLTLSLALTLTTSALRQAAHKSRHLRSDCRSPSPVYLSIYPLTFCSSQPTLKRAAGARTALTMLAAPWSMGKTCTHALGTYSA